MSVGPDNLELFPDSILDISRHHLEEFIRCPRCIYLEIRQKIKHPGTISAGLQNAVDQLLKIEFDTYRTKKKAHPLMVRENIDAIPLLHTSLPMWRGEKREGLSIFLGDLGVRLYGYIDDVWVTPKGSLIVVDYKSTAKKDTTDLLGSWKFSYQRQIELYSWIFKMNKFDVESKGYFLVCNADLRRTSFDQKLQFDMCLVPHNLDFSWIRPAIERYIRAITGDLVPISNPRCAYCKYRDLAAPFDRKGGSSEKS
jgi:CRISPR/Cas system-associated exonuclease Cas4 (RecB family)